jgi:hypothetical protein
MLANKQLQGSGMNPKLMSALHQHEANATHENILKASRHNVAVSGTQHHLRPDGGLPHKISPSPYQVNNGYGFAGRGLYI